MKTYKKWIAGGLIVALSAGGTFAYADSCANAKETNSVVVGVGSETEKKAVKTQSSLSMEKKETVYIFADANGGCKKVVVTDRITNPEAQKNFKDITNLENIVNIKGDEGFTQNGSSLDWQADGNDICYQGTTQADVPVGVKVSYFLDGKAITAEELAGKSGKVTVRFDYYNNQTANVKIDGKQEEIVVPFAMATAVLLDADKVANIEVTHGKIVEQGNVCAAVLVGMPKVADCLGLKDDFAADYAEITADVVDFSLTNTFTIATNNLFGGLSLDTDLDMDSLSDVFAQLSDATGKLVDGTIDLYNGAGELSDGARKLFHGADTLSGGAEELSENIEVLSNGAEELQNGAKTLSDSLKQFDAGVKNASDGAAKLAAGTSDLKAGAEQFAAGVKQAEDGVGALKEGSKSLSDGAGKLEAGAKELNGGLGEVGAGLAALGEGVDTAYQGLAQTIAYNQQVLDGLTVVVQTYGSQLDAQTAAALQTMIGTLQQTITAQQQIADSMAKTGELAGGVAALSEGTKKLTEGAKALGEGIHSLSDGAAALDAGVAELAGNLPQLTKGFLTISGGIDQVNSGAAGLSLGMTELTKASCQLAAGGSTLAQGVETLNSGAGALYTGSVTLADGAKELAGGAKELADGAKELYNGTETLKDGMREYSEKGIGKLLDALEEADLISVYNNLDAMIKAAADYKNFSGIAKETDGSVAFVIRTESIGK